jgi:hypothetical protein
MRIRQSSLFHAGFLVGSLFNTKDGDHMLHGVTFNMVLYPRRHLFNYNNTDLSFDSG